MSIDTYTPDLRRPSTGVWVVLVAVTVASWVLGADHTFLLSDPRVATSLVLALAFVKVQLVGTHFMELSHAPRLLQAAFSAWVLSTFVIVDAIYLLR